METRRFEESMLMSSFDLKSVKKKKRRKSSLRLASIYLEVRSERNRAAFFFPPPSRCRSVASRASSSTDGGRGGDGERKVMRLAAQLSTQESLLLVK